MYTLNHIIPHIAEFIVHSQQPCVSVTRNILLKTGKRTRKYRKTAHLFKYNVLYYFVFPLKRQYSQNNKLDDIISVDKMKSREFIYLNDGDNNVKH